MKTLIISLITSFIPFSCSPFTPSAPAPRVAAETWAFCGVHPDDAYAQQKANTMASVAGIDASFGPCMPPDWTTYSPANPGDRYVDPETYLRATVINAKAGMKTIVYDARIWNTDSHIRQEAINFWYPHRDWIRAWDMGDEFDPASQDWYILVDRWNIVLEYVTPQTGVGPFTNHLGNTDIFDKALEDMPAQKSHFSFDHYAENPDGYPQGLVDMARYLEPRVDHLMCAVNALEHFHFVPSASKLERQMREGRSVGCDAFLIFGGDIPVNTPEFKVPSLVNPNGTPTSLARAVARGA